MPDHDEVTLNPKEEKALQKEIWFEVLKQYYDQLLKHTPSEIEAGNIASLEKITNLSREKIEQVAEKLRHRYILKKTKKRNRMKPKSIHFKKRLKQVIGIIVVVSLVLIIGKCIHGEITSEMLDKAIGDGDFDHVKGLLAWGTDINGKFDSGRTPLMEAARLGYKKIIYLLLERNANVRIRDRLGKTAIEWAVNDEVRILLGRVYAESYPPDSPVRKLWAMEIIYTYDNYIEAITQNKLEVVELFLEAGMKPIKKNYYESSAIDIALKEGHITLFKFLLSRVRNKNSEEIHYTFFYAVAMNQVEIVNLLIEEGVSVKKAVKSIYNPLGSIRSKEILDIFVNHGALINIEERYSNGRTLLMKIVLDDYIDEEERIKMVKLLLDLGADPTVSNTGGTLIKQARLAQRYEIANLLLKAGAGD